MKTRTRFQLSLLMMALLGTIGAQPAFSANDDTVKLEELKRAMTTPGSESIPGKKKVRTRAIVFDSEPQVGSAPEAPVAPPTDCSSLSPDIKANAVDFAIQFKVGSADLSSTSEGTLIEIGKILSLSPDRCVLVEGHTDSTGNADKNMALSRDRAGSVVKFISERGGVERKRLIPIGKGSSDPIKNLDPRDPKNRRVVFKVVVG
ncbi:OmpA family protein [Denitratisoma oestradiolicum]|uniref:Uncharacterized protein n=1 Tax=Denitratisoma oestradiolicum TaxID=311182 RepID=A0A6S6XWU5_9PROT|nr:OmpA family protein [Denitratisoma oestradiolicum]TWO80863.1 hypothetical protein CBW56_06825 [Denitratisoma oestradiolicum]CAB1367382.1 conserved exported protein of unknown function [Denitratisoma oestradiolicum]